MEYTVNKLSKLSGVSARTLRYYDQIGLLKPARVASSGYRIYGARELGALQQILLYRELGFALEDIGRILHASDYDAAAAFERHLTQLHKNRERLDALIANVSKSIAALKGEATMTDREKFEGFKQRLIDENEQKYGAEVREKWGAGAAQASNAKLKGVTQAQYDEGECLRVAAEDALKAALATGDPAGELAQQTCDLHRQWLAIFAPDYSKDYHRGLGDMYAADERFRAYYDKIAPGAAEFLRDAINVYCG